MRWRFDVRKIASLTFRISDEVSFDQSGMEITNKKNYVLMQPACVGNSYLASTSISAFGWR